MVLETGEAIVSEGLGTGSLVSFVPLGHTFRTINKIAFQDTYKISYYLLDESVDSDEQDRIVLESGTEGGSGHVLMETSEREGMRIHQLDNLLQNFISVVLVPMRTEELTLHSVLTFLHQILPILP